MNEDKGTVINMKCQNCKSLAEINGFSGTMQFSSTKKAMTKNVINGFMAVISENEFETIYECTECHTKWRLAAPDFPVEGYFICE